MFDYHKENGSLLDPIFSHTAYGKLEKHPQEFVRYITAEEKLESPSMTRGDLFHVWLQHKDSFVIEDLDKPTGKVAEAIDAIFSLYVKEGYKTNTIFHEFCKRDYSIEPECYGLYRDFFISINKRMPLDDELKLLIYAVRFVRQEIEFGGKPGTKGAHKELTILEKIKEGLPYLNFLAAATGKIIMTKGDRNILTNCMESFRKHPLASKLYFEIEGLVEYEMFWEEEIYHDGSPVKIKRKGKIDKVIADYNKKILTILDPKTTSVPVGEFATDNNSPMYFRKYDRQLVSYARGWFKTNKVDSTGWTIQLLSIPVQTIEPYSTMIYKVESTINKCREQLDKLNIRAAHHKKTQNWNLTMEEQLNGGYVQI